ncbi:MAG TPA: hypothetical protein VF622_13255 [Segetibacter sp.]|jgi:hypothetical protein
MKPFLLLEFAEPAMEEDVDTSLVEYNNELNLNVIKGTTMPAINQVSLGTETFTKATGEGTDSDRDLSKNLSILMATATQTRQMIEGTDSDKRTKDIQCLMATRTLTEVRSESSDSDR